jgi:hypothetical protein
MMIRRVVTGWLRIARAEKRQKEEDGKDEMLYLGLKRDSRRGMKLI